MIYCLDAWGLYEDVYTEAFKLLEKLKGFDSTSRKSRLLPEVQDGEAELGLVVVDAVTFIFRAVAMSQQLDDKRYRKVLPLLAEVRDWFRVLDAKAYEKLPRGIVTNMGKCAISLVREAEADRFNGDLVQRFCELTLEEHYKAALSKDRIYYKAALSKDQIYKFARELLSALFGLKDRRMSVTIDISVSVLHSTCQFEVESNENLMEFIDLVAYCTQKFRAAGDMYSAKVSKELYEMAAIFSEAIPQLNVILRVYSAGLSITVCDSKFGESKVKDATDDWKIQALFDNEGWRSLVSLLGLVDSYLRDVGNPTDSLLIGGHKNYNNKTNDSCTDRNKKTCWPQFLDALKFLCQPLADLINSVKRKIVLETEMSGASAHLSTIHDAFLQFCDACLFLQRCTSDKGGRETDNNKALLNVAMAAFIVSLRTQLNLEISSRLVEDVIASPWIGVQELKYLIVSLYNIGIVLYRSKELKKVEYILLATYRSSMQTSIKTG